jgi:ABC-type transport system involved in multi-copper enzyme maturation permease subunit
LRPEQPAFYALLGDPERQTEARESSSWYRRFSGNWVARWDADLARRSGAVMLLSGALLLVTLFAVFLRSRSLRLSSLRPGQFAIALGVSSSAAFFVSSVVLRLSYQPYAEILQHFIRDGDETSLTNLRDFPGHAYAPIGSGWLTPRQDYASYFWFAVIASCAFALLVALLRYFQTRPRVNATI